LPRVQGYENWGKWFWVWVTDGGKIYYCSINYNGLASINEGNLAVNSRIAWKYTEGYTIITRDSELYVFTTEPGDDPTRGAEYRLIRTTEEIDRRCFLK
jgi:hypothetical protein